MSPYIAWLTVKYSFKKIFNACLMEFQQNKVGGQQARGLTWGRTSTSKSASIVTAFYAMVWNHSMWYMTSFNLCVKHSCMLLLMMMKDEDEDSDIVPSLSSTVIISIPRLFGIFGQGREQTGDPVRWGCGTLNLASKQWRSRLE